MEKPASGRFQRRNLKTEDALGESPSEMLSDTGSIPVNSTTDRLGMLTRSGLFYCNGRRMISMGTAFFET